MQDTAATDPVADFWRWWRQGGGAEVAEAVAASDTGRLSAMLDARVVAIHEELAWEIGQGEGGPTLVLVSGGRPQARMAAERWRMEAPEDPAWTWSTTRAARPGSQIRVDGRTWSGEDFQLELELDPSRERVDLTMHHPELGELEDAERANVAFLMLEAELGEDGLERWVGGVELAFHPLGEPIGFPAVRAALEELAPTATGERTVLFEGLAADGRPMSARANRALKRWSYPLHQRRVTLIIPLETADARGLPSPEEAAELDQAIAELKTDLDGLAVWAVTEDHGGYRTVHFYALQEAEQAIVSWADDLERELTMEVSLDPAWEDLAEYR